MSSAAQQRAINFVFFLIWDYPASAWVDAHSHLLIRIIQKFTTQGSSKVATKINHRKKKEKLSELGMLQSSSRPPSSLVENILGNDSKAVASRNRSISWIEFHFVIIIKERETFFWRE
jgi:hypothetical protein